MNRQAIVERRVSNFMCLPGICLLPWVMMLLPMPGIAGITINEILADPASGLQGDANGDGVRSGSRDEFVEIVYDASESALDISGWTLSDATSIRHIFPSGTLLDPHTAIVVFGGGSPTGSFGSAIVQTASTGGLGLNNAGDTVLLSNGLGMDVTVLYGAEAGDNQSITRDPDITGAFTRHLLAVGSGGARFSPGTTVSRMPFSAPDSDSGATAVPVPGALSLVILGCGSLLVRRAKG